MTVAKAGSNRTKKIESPDDMSGDEKIARIIDSPVARWAAGIAGGFVVGFSFWTASSIVENKSTLAGLKKDVAIIRERVSTTPPQDYRDLQNQRFHQIEASIEAILKTVDKIDTTLDHMREVRP